MICYGYETLSEEAKRNIDTARRALYDVLDNDHLDELYVKNCKMYQPFFFPGRVTTINADEDGELLAHEESVVIFRNWVYDMEDELVYATNDPNCIIIFNHGRGELLREDGQYHPYENSYVHVFHFEGGKIAEYYEYAEQVNLMRAMGLDVPSLPEPEETNRRYAELGLL